MRVLAMMVGAAEPAAVKAGATGINKRPVTGPIHSKLRAQFAAKGKGAPA